MGVSLAGAGWAGGISLATCVRAVFIRACVRAGRPAGRQAGLSLVSVLVAGAVNVCVCARAGMRAVRSSACVRVRACACVRACVFWGGACVRFVDRRIDR